MNPHIEGFWKTRPMIKKISFSSKGKIILELKDGRLLSVPLKYFPSIKKLNSNERKYYTILNQEGIAFRNSNEVFHIQDFLGKEQLYRYAG